jgi:hypothetical protein
MDVLEELSASIFSVKQSRMNAQQALIPNNTASHPRRL